MPLDASALSSLSSSLDTVVERLGQLADGADPDEDALVELREVERQLQASSRRLARVIRRVG